MIEYKGYLAEIEYDDSVGVLHGRVVNVGDVMSFEAESAKEVRQAFAEAVDDYLAWCAERGQEPERPYTGHFIVRGTPELHRAVVVAAARQNKSMNAFVTEALGKAVGV